MQNDPTTKQWCDSLMRKGNYKGAIDWVDKAILRLKDKITELEKLREEYRTAAKFYY